MAGQRVEPVVTQRLATMAQAQGARTVGGRIPAQPRLNVTTADTPRRVAQRPPLSSGLYIPPFSVAGTLTVATYGTLLRNITGAPLTITAVSAEVGSAPSGGSTTVRLRINGVTQVTLTLTSGSTFASSTGLALSWPAGASLGVQVPSVAPTPGDDLVLQVLTA